MGKPTSILIGAALILLGVLALISSPVLSALGLSVGILALRMWPLIVAGVGLFFVVPPLLVRGRRSRGALFIPGFPILMTGTLLCLASIFDAWGIWAWLWPLEILALATGFLFAAIYMRVIWLLVPAIIIGLNALVFQFCAVTGLWGAWSVLWLIEPLSVGLALLVVGAATQRAGLSTAGIVLCCMAGVALVGMTIILTGWWPVTYLLPALFILAGASLLAWGMVRHLLLPRSALG